MEGIPPVDGCPGQSGQRDQSDAGSGGEVVSVAPCAATTDGGKVEIRKTESRNLNQRSEVCPQNTLIDADKDMTEANQGNENGCSVVFPRGTW